MKSKPSFWKAECIDEHSACDITGNTRLEVEQTLLTKCQAHLDEETGEWYAPFNVTFGPIKQVS